MNVTLVKRNIVLSLSGILIVAQIVPAVAQQRMSGNGDAAISCFYWWTAESEQSPNPEAPEPDHLDRAFGGGGGRRRHRGSIGRNLHGASDRCRRRR